VGRAPMALTAPATVCIERFIGLLGCFLRECKSCCLPQLRYPARRPAMAYIDASLVVEGLTSLPLFVIWAPAVS